MSDRLRKIITILLICVILVCIYFIGHDLMMSKKEADDVKYVDNIVAETLNDQEDTKFNLASYKALKDANSDFVGYLAFDSGIIEEPVVQCGNNSYYLSYTFNKNYSTLGTVFIDADATIDDTNFTIFGHNNSYDFSVKFSKLNDLIQNQTTYEDNAYFSIYFENEIRDYVICYMYYISEEEFQDYNFMRTTFSSKGDFEDFIGFARRKTNITPIDGGIEYGNNFVTLQTCKRMNASVKVIAVAREIMRHSY